MPRTIWIHVLTGIILRILYINSPMLDAFVNMRQTYTAGFTRYMIQKGVTFSNLISAKSVTVTHDALEVPLYNLLTVGLAEIFGDRHFIYRPTSLIYWIIGAIYFNYLLKRIYKPEETKFIIWVYVLIPLSIFIGRYYHPEILSLLLSMAVVFHFYFFLNKGKWLDLLISIIALTLTMLIRASHCYLFFAILILSFNKHGLRLILKPWIYAYLLPLVAFILWTCMGSDLSGNYRILQLLGPPLFRFTPTFLGMILFNRLGGLVLSPVGLPLLILALFSSKKRENRDLEFAWLYSSLIYLFIVARGNFMNFHYQAPIILPSSILIGRFLYQLSSGTLIGSWHQVWLEIRIPIKAVLLSLYIFLTLLVLYCFYTFHWDYNLISENIKNMNFMVIVIIFLISQVILIPLIIFLSRSKFLNVKSSNPKLAIAFLILILITGFVNLAPMYKVDNDYLVAASTIDSVLPKDVKIVFSGKKSDADPLIFYSNRWGWEFNPEDLYYHGMKLLDILDDENSLYFVIMNSNRYIQPEHPFSEKINSILSKFKIHYTDETITIYDLKTTP